MCGCEHHWDHNAPCTCQCPDHEAERREMGATSSALIPLPWPKPPLTGNRTRGNVYARANEVKVAKDAAIVAVRAARPEPMTGAEVTLHFRPRDKRRRDADGLAPTLKVVLDALVVCGVLPDDSWVHVPAATCRIHPPEGKPAMWVGLAAVVTSGAP